MSSNYTPWWVDSSSDNNANNIPYQGDTYSIDSSLYIEEDNDNQSQKQDDDRSDVNVIPDVPSPPPARRVVATSRPRNNNESLTHAVPSRSSFRSAPDNRDFGPTMVVSLPVDGHPSRTTTSTTAASASAHSPGRKKLHELSSSLTESISKGTEKISKGTAKLSKNLSKQWKSITTTPERPKKKHPSHSQERCERPMPTAAPMALEKAVALQPTQRNDVTKTSPPHKPLTESLTKNLSDFGKKAMQSFRSSDQQQQQQQQQQQHQRTQSTLMEGSTQRESRSSRSGRSSSTGSNTSTSTDFRRYTVKELVQSLGRPDVDLPPALERRVRDFKFAQAKRGERHGENKPWGIFGLYAHLSDIRADLEWAEDAAWRRQRKEPYLSWSDFEKSRDKGFHNRPWFTYGVIALCTVMLVVTFGVNDWSIEPLNVNPLIGPSSDTLIKVGARQTDLIVNEGQWYRLFTPLILHAGLVHYLINMSAMYFIGGAVEQSHGFASAAVLFILPAVGGNILSAICLPQYISVGASGGIFGLIGGCIADISINWNLLFLKSTADQESRWRHFMVLFWLAFDMILNCILGFTPFVDNFTHLGGFLYGLCCGLSTIERLAVGFFGLESNKYSKKWNTFMRFFGLIASVISIMVTTVILVQSDGVTSPCHGCRYISCVPFPPRADDKWWYCDDCDFVTADLFVDSAGTGLYKEIELTCPNGDVEVIDITDDAIYEKDALRRDLPTYCRNHCDDVFMASN